MMEEESQQNTISVPGISVSAASDEEHEGEFSLIENIPMDKNKERRTSASSISSLSSSSELGDYANNSSNITDEQRDDYDDDEHHNPTDDEVKEILNGTESMVINENGIVPNGDGGTTTQKPYEVVGDRVLIERDGKFELVDVNDVKADYFQMMGFAESSEVKVSLEEKPASADETATEVKEELLETSSIGSSSPGRKSPRPKTSPVKTFDVKKKPENRVASAYVKNRERDEYAHIKSRYAMTEQQLEMKKRREEAIAKRKREEEERKQEEARQKQQDAERAFQAWLQAKNEDAISRRKHPNNEDIEKREERNREAESAYQSWLLEKGKQKKQQKTLDRLKLEEEASSYVIRERRSCEEAFNNWLKMKQAEARKKMASRKPRHKKRRSRNKEQPPINSTSIRFTDYYGYRNTVAL